MEWLSVPDRDEEATRCLGRTGWSAHVVFKMPADIIVHPAILEQIEGLLPSHQLFTYTFTGKNEVDVSLFVQNDSPRSRPQLDHITHQAAKLLGNPEIVDKGILKYPVYDDPLDYLDSK